MIQMLFDFVEHGVEHGDDDEYDDGSGNESSHDGSSQICDVMHFMWEAGLLS